MGDKLGVHRLVRPPSGCFDERNDLKKPAQLEVTGLAPLPPVIEEWERAVIEPVLARLFDAPKVTTNDEPEEVRDGEDAC